VPAGCAVVGGLLTNPSFESPVLSDNSWSLVADTTVTGWHTSESDGVIEVWRGLPPDGTGLLPPHGSQAIELNANAPSEVYQDVTTVPGVIYRFSFWHRGRAGIDTADVLIGSTSSGDAPSGGQESSATGGAGWAEGNTGWSSLRDLHGPGEPDHDPVRPQRCEQRQ
jgi:hypothetical protein